jgi:methanogenic corrinoid protein MtbC1
MISTGEAEQITAFKEALLSLDRLEAKTLIERSLASASVRQTAEMLMVSSLEQIGAGWQAGKIALSQVYMSGCICEELVNSLFFFDDRIRKDQPKMAIAVLDDYHMLGKRIVYSVLRTSGYRLLDYGRKDVESLAEASIRDQVDMLFISTLMLRSALKVKDLKAKLAAQNAGIKIIVGGAPFRLDRQLWKEVGADACGLTASDAAAIASRFSGGGA